MANRDPKRPKPNLPDLKVPRPGADDGQNRRRPATSEELATFLGKRGLVRYTPKPLLLGQGSADG